MLPSNTNNLKQNDILVGYLIPKPSLEKKSIDII